MAWLVNLLPNLLPLLIPLLLSQLKGGAAATVAALEAGQPETIASTRVAGQHWGLQIVLLSS